jgi:hypothetical protein
VGVRATAFLLWAALVAGCAKSPASAPTDVVEPSKGPDGPETKTVRFSQRWSGENGDPEREKFAPPSLLITTRTEFEKVWSAWWRIGQVPEVDFATSFVVVRTSSPARAEPKVGMDGIWIVALKIAPDGSSTVVTEPSLATDTASWTETKGFYWGLAVFPREGVKTVDGKELPAP